MTKHLVELSRCRQQYRSTESAKEGEEPDCGSPLSEQEPERRKYHHIQDHVSEVVHWAKKRHPGDTGPVGMPLKVAQWEHHDAYHAAGPESE